MVLSSLGKHKDAGLLLMRLAIGVAYMVYGYPKITGGLEMWRNVGSAMNVFGIEFGAPFWGALAAISEFIGGFLILIGFAFRPACLFLSFTMLVATLFHLQSGDGFDKYSHAATMCLVFLGLLFTGAGKYSLDRK
ncbi:MAG TPA: DoxX family protein [Anseongella sp.]|nr:DoxX family protein [Anseongella sp.]